MFIKVPKIKVESGKSGSGELGSIWWIGKVVEHNSVSKKIREA
jgi:hypothetical protein